MPRKSAPSLVDYVWRNYRHLIDAETHYLSKLRALLFRGEASGSIWTELNAQDRPYLEWPRHALQREVSRLEVDERESIALAVLEKYPAEVILNRCPDCAALTVSPVSERCIACGHTWYGTNPHRPTLHCVQPDVPMSSTSAFANEPEQCDKPRGK
jgi:hypothetical protein